MNSDNTWKEQAEALFFVDHLSIKDICNLVNKTRKYVLLVLKASTNYDYDKERDWRKEQSRKKRKEYKRQWDRDNRDYSSRVTGDTLRQEHEQAVKILSHEKYY